jgi:hypothetical protein
MFCRAFQDAIVDVSNEYDCVDTACINIILSDVESISNKGFTVQPNPSGEFIGTACFENHLALSDDIV